MNKSRIGRMDNKLFDDLFKAGAVRVQKKLSKCKLQEMGMPKITHLLTRCPSYPSIIDELTKLPEREQ